MWTNKNLILTIFISLLILSSLKANQNVLNFSSVEKISFNTHQFQIVGNLYLPKSTAPYALVIWIHGSGPDLRASKFPGTAFINTFLDNGFAYFRYDKPGSGDSKGQFTDSLLFQERAQIVSAAVDLLKKRPDIDSTRIGLVGSSQAGYVIPIVLSTRNDIAFMIGLSLPAETGHEQWAYLLKMQLIYEGYSKEKAEEFRRMYLRLIRSANYQEFLETIRYFENNPVHISSLNGYDENFAKSLHDWWPLDWTKAQSFDPMELMKGVKIPALIVYGVKDTQVDPHQGADAYKNVFRAAGNPFYEVISIPDADHNMFLAMTGSLKEQKERNHSELSPVLVENVRKWLTKLKHHLDNMD
jgi:pimeloyl-ACP methyl ester carboxylesterase